MTQVSCLFGNFSNVIRLEEVAEPEFRSLAILDLDEMAAFAHLDAVLRVQNRRVAQILKVIIKVAGYKFVYHIYQEGLKCNGLPFLF